MQLNVDTAALDEEAEGAGAPVLDSRKARSERIDNAADAIRELNKRFHERLTLDNPRFVDRYLESKLHLLVRFGVSGIDEQFIACLEGKRYPQA